MSTCFLVYESGVVDGCELDMYGMKAKLRFCIHSISIGW